MEGDRRVQIIIAVVAAVLLAFAYGVGYYVGKGSGIEEEKKICEIQKRQLIKTLSRITPVSRPEPVEEKVVGTQPQTSQKEVSSKEVTKTLEQKVSQQEVPKKEVANPQEKTAEKEVKTVKNGQEEKADTVSVVKKGESVVKPKTQEVAEKTPQVKEKPSNGKKYYLQLGIFRNEANAVKLAEELNKKGFQSKTVFGKRYVKVIVGYFDSLHQARVVQKELRSAGFDSVLKWRRN